jgi:hypothetical protein
VRRADEDAADVDGHGRPTGRLERVRVRHRPGRRQVGWPPRRTSKNVTQIRNAIRNAKPTK